MPDDRLIVALDTPNSADGRNLVDRLGNTVGFYKIGLGMLADGGLALADELRNRRGLRVFLDMKLFDIEATVETATRGLARFGFDFLTVHGDPHVVHAARRGAENSGMKILAVTILTSLDRQDLDACLVRNGTIPDLVLQRARLAFAAGADGVIASPQEAKLLRTLPQSQDRLIVTPGVRPSGTVSGDQKRVASPAQAITCGADHIVVGRPIRNAADPCAAVRSILAELP